MEDDKARIASLIEWVDSLPYKDDAKVSNWKKEDQFELQRRLNELDEKLRIIIAHYFELECLRNNG